MQRAPDRSLLFCIKGTKNKDGTAALVWGLGSVQCTKPTDRYRGRERFSMNTAEQVQKAAQSQKDAEDFANKQADPRSGDSLVPMLVAGVVLTFGGMIAALAFSSMA
jgi:hypothetical protein